MNGLAREARLRVVRTDAFGAIRVEEPDSAGHRVGEDAGVARRHHAWKSDDRLHAAPGAAEISAPLHDLVDVVRGIFRTGIASVTNGKKCPFFRRHQRWNTERVDSVEAADIDVSRLKQGLASNNERRSDEQHGNSEDLNQGSHRSLLRQKKSTTENGKPHRSTKRA